MDSENLPAEPALPDPLDLLSTDREAVVRDVPPPPTVPAGWYPDPDNHNGFRFGGVPSMRYFDGARWTDSRAPMQRSQRPAGFAPQQPIVVAQQVVNAAPPVVVMRGGTNHGLHLVLTLLTCGAWLPVWIILIIVNGGR